MNIFREQDLDVLNEKIGEIQKNIDKIRLMEYEPNFNEQTGIMNIIKKYIKQKKRKIYGGFAINELIKQKNKDDAFYKEDEQVADIDFYSTDPIGDLHALCNLIFNAGYKNLQGREADHPETYSIFINRINYVDITYTPKNIYNTIPFIDINGMYMTHPSFIKIDYYRMFSDPIVSYWRIEKTYTRFALLDKHFPEKKIEKPYKLIKPSVDISKVLLSIFKYLSNKTEIMFVGEYAYNYFLKESNIKKKYIKQLPVTKFEVILTEYKNQASELFNLLKDKYGDDISITEYYPFFQIIGYRFNIFYKKQLVLCGEHYNDKCIPYKIVESDLFDLKTKYSAIVTLASYDRNILFVMTRAQYYKTNNDKNIMYNYKTMLSHLLEMRRYYLESNKKTILDNSLFEEFLIKCIGSTLLPQTERQRLINKRIAKGKPINYTYYPDRKQTDGSDINHSFYNTSGNAIRNPRNLRVLADIDTEEQLPEEQGEEIEKI